MVRLIPLILLASFLLPAPLRAELVLPQAGLDLGKVRSGQQSEHRLPIVNAGSAAAEVFEIKSGCGCVKADIEPRVIPPGKRGQLILKVNTLSAGAGAHSWRVTVRSKSGAAEQESVMLVHAQVYQEIIVQPPSIIIYSDSATRHELAVTDLRTQPLRIVKLEPSSPHLQAVVSGEHRSPEGHLVRTIRLDVGAGFTPGRHDESLVIHTDDPLYRQLQVSLSVVKKPRQRYCAYPPGVTLVASPEQPTPTRIVTLRENEGKPLEIESVTADDPAIACQWSQGPGIAVTVKLTVDKGKMLGDTLESRVHVRFKGAEMEKFSVPVRCEAR